MTVCLRCLRVLPGVCQVPAVEPDEGQKGQCMHKASEARLGPALVNIERAPALRTGKDKARRRAVIPHATIHAQHNNSPPPSSSPPHTLPRITEIVYWFKTDFIVKLHIKDCGG